VGRDDLPVSEFQEPGPRHPQAQGAWGDYGGARGLADAAGVHGVQQVMIPAWSFFQSGTNQGASILWAPAWEFLWRQTGYDYANFHAGRTPANPSTETKFTSPSTSVASFRFFGQAFWS
jgi:hypothetical protein